MKKRIEHIADSYGYVSQRLKTFEEMGELAQALVKDNKNAIAEEIADVYIMITQLSHLLDIDLLVDDNILRKVERQEKRLKNTSPSVVGVPVGDRIK